MNGASYIEVLKDHLLSVWHIHEREMLWQDSASVHKSKRVKDVPSECNINALERPVHSLGLNQVGNA